MPSASAKIQHVSDTAIWVAHYRALESERPDALFHDNLAKVLTGTRGREIAESLANTSRYSQWSVVIRTLVIDEIIRRFVAGGVETIINLGAGLDTRPYRLDLPESLRWIEVDYPSIIEHKERLLESEKPRVQLERIALDLANLPERRKLFASLNAQSKSALVLTEGVIPYLSEEQVGALAEDLHAEGNFHYWIAEYYSPRIYRYFKTKRRTEQMKNAPFRFFPADWFAFFQARGWAPHETRYLPEEGLKVGRPLQLPWWARLIVRIASEEKRAGMRKQTAYIVLGRYSSETQSAADPASFK